MKYFINGLLASFALVAGCTDALLDAKPDQALVVPKTLADFSALLDNTSVFHVTPGVLNIAADDFVITDAGYAALRTPIERNGYTWADDVYEGQRILDWNKPYEQVFYSNVVLEGLVAIDSAMAPVEYARIKGTALFCRGLAFYNLAQLFCSPYLDEGDGSLPGIPLRLTANINASVGRASIAETYERLWNDLTTSYALLPDQTPYKTRPTRAAAAALLARIYLNSNRYTEALTWAEEALQLSPDLLDFASFESNGTRPFPQLLPNGNVEALYYALLGTNIFNANSLRSVYIPAATYQLYDPEDIRKSVYFAEAPQGGHLFVGSYMSPNQLFGGPATGEVYLIKAECLARLGRGEEAISTLNHILEHRYAVNAFEPIDHAHVADAVGLILTERRKELIGRGLRWSDLRRLNRETGREITITRVLEGAVYTLPPHSSRYVFPIPDEEILLSGIPQNPR